MFLAPTRTLSILKQVPPGTLGQDKYTNIMTKEREELEAGENLPVTEDCSSK